MTIKKCSKVILAIWGVAAIFELPMVSFGFTKRYYTTVYNVYFT